MNILRVHTTVIIAATLHCFMIAKTIVTVNVFLLPYYCHDYGTSVGVSSGNKIRCKYSWSTTSNDSNHRTGRVNDQ